MLSALLRKSLYFITLVLATIFVIHFLPTFAQQTPKLSDFYPPTAIPTVTRTPTRIKIPSATPINAPTYLPGTPSPTPLPSGYPSLTLSPSKKPTKTPTPTNGGNVLAQAVDNLASKIIAACPNNGVVKTTTVQCLDKITPPLNSNVSYELRASVTSNNYLQCVGFARAAYALVNGQRMPDMWGNAKDYVNLTLPGYVFMHKGSGNIKANDIPVWTDSTWGHIAYVVETYGSSYFRIAEANMTYGGGESEWGIVRHDRNVSTTDPGLAGWHRRQ